MTKPVSKNHMEARHWVNGMPEDFRYCPDCSANGNMAGEKDSTPEAQCGAHDPIHAQGLGTWGKWYDSAGVQVTTLVPGGELDLEVQLTADHGGQAWLQVACGDHIDNDLVWTLLERAPGDRDHHFMPNNPGVFAWRQQEYGYAKFSARYTVPGSFSCPSGMGVGRWVWKTGNTCLDENNLGRSTETFNRADYEAVVGSRSIDTCSVAPEVFISCFDFKVLGEYEGPVPTLAPLPTPSPKPEPKPEPTPTPTPAPSPPPSTECSKVWDQCGGQTWSGPTCCDVGLTCSRTNEWYSQCTPGSFLQRRQQLPTQR